MTTGASRPSQVRLFAGIIIFLAAIGATLHGFSALGTALDVRGYGSDAVRHALVWLGAAGGGLGAGVALLIWEFSVRLQNRERR